MYFEQGFAEGFPVDPRGTDDPNNRLLSALQDYRINPRVAEFILAAVAMGPLQLYFSHLFPYTHCMGLNSPLQ